MRYIVGARQFRIQRDHWGVLPVTEVLCIDRDARSRGKREIVTKLHIAAARTEDTHTLSNPATGAYTHFRITRARTIRVDHRAFPLDGCAGIHYRLEGPRTKQSPQAGLKVLLSVYLNLIQKLFLLRVKILSLLFDSFRKSRVCGNKEAHNNKTAVSISRQSR